MFGAVLPTDLFQMAHCAICTFQDEWPLSFIESGNSTDRTRCKAIINPPNSPSCYKPILAPHIQATILAITPACSRSR